MNEQPKQDHFCPNCGSELTSITSFCPHCGGKIVPETLIPETKTETETVSEEIPAETETATEEIPATENVGTTQQPPEQFQSQNRTAQSIKQFILKNKIPIILSAGVALILIIVIAFAISSQACIKGENFTFTELEFIDMVNSKTDIYIDPESYDADGFISGYSATFNDEDGYIYLGREGLSEIKMILVDFSYHDTEELSVAAKIGSIIDSHFSERDAFYHLSNGEIYCGGKLTAYCADDGCVLTPTELMKRLGYID